MSLVEAIKELVAKNGVSFVDTKQFVNVLDDVGAFKNEPAASKKVLKGLMDSGFGTLIIQYSKKKDSNWQNVIRKSVSDYASKSGYKDELINELASSVLFAVGIINEMPKVATDSVQKSNVSPNTQIKDPKELMYSLKQEYVTALRELITIKTDEYGFNYGYYTTEANSTLYVIESKIRLIAKELGDFDVDWWLSNDRLKVENDNRPSTSDIDRALNDIMSALVREYNAQMEKGYIVEDDEFGLKSARFNQNVVSDLLAIEKKIIAVGKRKNEDKQSWIDKTKSDFLASKSSPASARNGVLDQLKNEYQARLSEIDRNTKGKDIDFADTSLIDIRKKLINLGSLLGQNMEAWCDAENNRVSEERVKCLSKRKKRNLIIGPVAGVALLIGGVQTISYTSSEEARRIYTETMASANAELAKGNYVEAITLFQQAENEYNASYSSSSYKGEAHSKAASASDKIITDWSNQVIPLLESNHPAKAKALTMALPSNLVVESASEEKYKEITQRIDNDLANRATTIIEELLNDVYANHGKISVTAKQELNEMIEVIPDNYWLNFIKEKSK